MAKTSTPSNRACKWGSRPIQNGKVRTDGSILYKVTSTHLRMHFVTWSKSATTTAKQVSTRLFHNAPCESELGKVAKKRAKHAQDRPKPSLCQLEQVHVRIERTISIVGTKHGSAEAAESNSTRHFRAFLLGGVSCSEPSGDKHASHSDNEGKTQVVLAKDARKLADKVLKNHGGCGVALRSRERV